MCMREHVHVYACVCVYVSVYVYVYAWVYVCVHALKFISALHDKCPRHPPVCWCHWSLAFSKTAERRVYHTLALDSGVCIVNGGFGSRKVRGGGTYLLAGFPKFAWCDLLCHSDSLFERSVGLNCTNDNKLWAEHGPSRMSVWFCSDHLFF